MADGRRIGEWGLTFAPESASAPVSQDNCVRLRSTSSGSALEVSYDGAAYVTLGGSGSTAWSALTAPTGDLTLNHGDYKTVFNFDGGDAEDCFLIQSANNAAGSGVVLYVATQGASTTKAPLRVDAKGSVGIVVDVNGALGVGTSSVTAGTKFELVGKSNQTVTETGTSGTKDYLTQTITISPASASSSIYYHDRKLITFGTAQNLTGTIAVRSSSVEHSQNATLANYYAYYDTFGKDTGGAATSVIGHEWASSVAVGTTDYAAGYRSTIGQSGGTLTYADGVYSRVTVGGTGTVTEAVGVYSSAAQSGGGTFTKFTAFIAASSGTIATKYGFLAGSGWLNGFGTYTPDETLHVSGTIQFDLGSDATGDIYYRSGTSGRLARLAMGSALQVLRVNAGGTALEYAASTAVSDGSGTEIQRTDGAGGFVKVTSSAVSGADVTWAGKQTQTVTNTATGAGTQDFNTQTITLSPASASSVTVYYHDRRAVAFGTAQNINGSVVVRSTSATHSQNSTLANYWASYDTFTKDTAGAATTIYGHEWIGTVAVGTSDYVGGYRSTIACSGGTTTYSDGFYSKHSVSGGTTTEAVGYYAEATRTSGTFTKYTGFIVGGSGTIGTKYGFLAASGWLSGFGTLTPDETLHVSGTVQFDLGSDATGDVYYRSATSGRLARLAVGTDGYVLTLASGLPSWAAAVAPAGSGSELQYRSSATAFGAVTSSSVSGANITLGGKLTQTATNTATGAGTQDYNTQTITLSPASASSVTAYYNDRRVVTFGTAQNINGSLVVRSTSTTHSQSATLANYWASYDEFTKDTGGAATSVYGHQWLAANAVGTCDYSGGYSSTITASGGTITSSDGLYSKHVVSGGTLTAANGYYAEASRTSGTFTKFTAFAAIKSGTIGTAYGFVSSSGFLHGFGTLSPATTLHVDGTIRFVLGSDADGDTWYRSSSNVTRLAIGTSGYFYKSTGSAPSWAQLSGSDIGTGTVALARGGTGASLTDPNADRIMFWDDSAGVVDWLTVGSGLSISGTTLTATAAGDTPGGSGTEIQYRAGASTLGAVTSSSVSGADVTWAGKITQTATNTATGAGTQDYNTQTITLSPASASSVTTYYHDRRAVVFGTAQNINGSVVVRSTSATHSQNSTIANYWASYDTFTKDTNGQATTIYGHEWVGATAVGTTDYHGGYKSSITASGGTLTYSDGFYSKHTASGATVTEAVSYYAEAARSSGTFTTYTAFKATKSGTIGTAYGFVSGSGFLHGLGTLTPGVTLDVVGGSLFTMTTGDTFRVTSDVLNTGLEGHAFGTTNNPLFFLVKGRGTKASPTAVQSGDTLGSFSFAGQYSSTVGQVTTAASIRADAQQTFAATNDKGADLVFSTSYTGSLAVHSGLRIQHNQYVLVAKNSSAGDAGAQFHVLAQSDSTVTSIFNTSSTSATADLVRFQHGGTTKFKLACISGGAVNAVFGSAALSTSATDGFIWIPTCAGAASGTPSSYTGTAPMVLDTTNFRIYFNVPGTGWKYAALV